jgi:hypothetical protein
LKVQWAGSGEVQSPALKTAVAKGRASVRRGKRHNGEETSKWITVVWGQGGFYNRGKRRAK